MADIPTSKTPEKSERALADNPEELFKINILNEDPTARYSKEREKKMAKTEAELGELRKVLLEQNKDLPEYPNRSV